MRIIYILLLAGFFTAEGCTVKITAPATKTPAKTATRTTPKTNPNGKVPPGQMKKTTGSQSAKPYAPGQNKKK